MPDQAINAARELGEKVDRLADRVSDLNRSVKRGRVVTAVLSIVCIATLALAVGIALNIRYSAHQAACVREYANSAADRTNTLVPLANKRNQAQDDFFKVLATKDQTKITASYVSLVKTNTAYEDAIAANPAPLAPRYAC